MLKKSVNRATPGHQVAVVSRVLMTTKPWIKRKDTGTLLRNTVKSDTISSLENMGHHFGDLAKVRHIITYSLSPFEQRAFANYFSKGIPNVWRRFSTAFFRVAPPMVIMYLTYSWGNSVHEHSKRKIPADHDNVE